MFTSKSQFNKLRGPEEKEVKRPLLILAIESSCDDTSVAVLRANEGDLVPDCLSVAIQSQWEVHEKFQGVVPELASRAHLRNLIPCLEKALSDAGCKLDDIDLFAATGKPGLIGCLLIGHSAAKTFSLLYQKPFISCHHIEAHLLSVFLNDKNSRPKFPFLALVVSGGHTSMYVMHSLDEYELLGETLDDALGEAFDKGAKLLGLPFPGGPYLEKLARESSLEKPIFLGKVVLKDSEFSFSFSGLKSEFARRVQKSSDNEKADLAFSYQEALFDHLFEKIKKALIETGFNRLAIVGGVAANQRLRDRLEELKKDGLLENWFAPVPRFCTDNAAMVGVRAYRSYVSGEISNLEADVQATARPKISDLRKNKLALRAGA